MELNNTFKDIIKTYLDQRAQSDELFAVSYTKENKNIDDCCDYIISQAKKEAKEGCAAISDDKVFGWAVHYYDEDNIKVEKMSNIRSGIKSSDFKAEDRKDNTKTRIKPKAKAETNQLTLFSL